MWRPKLLCCTALIYILPFLLSIKNSFPLYFSVGLGASVICSEFYHGWYDDLQWRRFLKPIDMTICHVVVLMHVWIAHTVCLDPFTWNIFMLYACIAYAIITYWMIGLSVSNTWHAVLHLVTGFGSTCFILGPCIKQ